MHESTLITKVSGTTELFDVNKLSDSLRRTGAPPETTQKIIDHVISELYEGMTTAQIYSHAYQLLKKFKGAHAALYDLRKSLSRLGPSGYPFEAFVAEIWKHLGYEVKLGQMTAGKLISHDVDVMAVKRSEVNMMECKYHREDQTKVDSKTAMYVSARYADIRAKFEGDKNNGKKIFKAWLVTNTKFTLDAIRFAEGWDLHLLGWGYPRDNGIEKMIEKANLHPVTCLTSLNHDEIDELLRNKVVLCQNLHDPKVQKMLRLRGGRLDRLHEEISDLCGINPAGDVKPPLKVPLSSDTKKDEKFEF